MLQTQPMPRKAFVATGIGALLTLAGCQQRASNSEPKETEDENTQESKETEGKAEPKDVFTISGVERGEDDDYGYWEMYVTVVNNSKEPQQFLGFQIDELDMNGNIIDSYMSYNKNAAYTTVEPGQSYTIDLTEAVDDNVVGMQSRYCEYGDEDDPTRSDYSTPYKQMF